MAKTKYDPSLAVEIKTQDQIWDELVAEACSLGLDLNYVPDIHHEDISTLSVEAWVELRKDGIGGSDAGTIMGVNKYKSLMSLALDKEGKLEKEAVDKDKQFIFDYGHAMEDCLALYFARTTGFEVFKDNRMFKHPYYPWMLADCDSFCYDNDGLKCGLEFKTSMSDNAKKWRGGIYGKDAILPNLSYLWQIRHYMAVTNLTRWYLVIGFDNQSSKIQIIRIDRDLNEEVRLINAEYDFWNNYVAIGEVPEFEYASEDDFKDVKKSLVSAPDDTSLKIEFDYELGDKLKDILSLQQDIKDREAIIKNLKERLEELKLPIMEVLGESEEGFYPVDETLEIKAIFKSQERRGVDTDKLMQVYPEVYEDVKKPTITRPLKISEFHVASRKIS